MPSPKLSSEEKKRLIKDTRLYNTYGITLKEWEQKLADQGGVCGMCNTLPNSGVLCTDHLHIKGFKKMLPEQKKKYVRGLICFLCNTSFGRIERRKDPRDLLNRINKYFSQYPIKGEIS